MTTWDAILLGFVQGATEFLPVSSSGHLVAGQAVLSVNVPGVVFEVAVHVATLLSILVVYRARVATLVSGAARGRVEAWRYVGLLIVATIPAVAVGLPFQEPLEALFERPVVVGLAFLVTGTFLWTTRSALAREGRRQTLGIRDAVLIGLAQAFAMIPGISRSGATVVTALWLRVEPDEAAEFSFLMAVPAIAGAAVLQIPDVLAGENGGWGTALLLGSVMAAVTGVLAIRTFVAMLRRRSFHVFGVYCWLLGATFLLWLWAR